MKTNYWVWMGSCKESKKHPKEDEFMVPWEAPFTLKERIYFKKESIKHRIRKVFEKPELHPEFNLPEPPEFDIDDEDIII